tara:strand:+ start:91470 stop:92390 length:921 start_codon:yes stop_codon:yes gene_type:complete
LSDPESRYNLLVKPKSPKWKITNDLHLHTSISDGNITPNDLIIKISKTDINCISITDHDITEAIDECKEISIEKNITVIPGVEISTSFQKNDIHILGYFIDYKNIELQSSLGTLRNSRKKSILKTISILQDNGFEISEKEVTDISKGTIGRPHIAQILKSKGYFNSTTEAFEKILTNKKIVNIKRKKIDTLHSINLINQAGGIAVLAHPRSIKDLEKVIPIFVENGLGGIEVFSEKHKNETLNYLKNISEKYNLVATGGSDYHGRNEPNEIMPGMNGAPPETPHLLLSKTLEFHGSNIGSVPKGLK